MLPLSLLILVLLGTLQIGTDRDALQPISVELANSNPLAWILMAALCVMIVLFAQRLRINGFYVRTLLLVFIVVGLIVIAFSAYTSQLHQMMLLAITVLTAIWFTVAAVRQRLSAPADTVCHKHYPAAFPCRIVDRLC